MVKDAVSSSGSIKKRRKNASNTEDGEVDIYKKVLDFEEKEALQRSATDDAEIYFSTCSNVKSLLENIFKLKEEGAAQNRSKIQEICTEACVQIAILKKLNRLEKFRTITAREALIQEKQKVDSVNLQYQNLLYEAAHLMSEYKKCQQFKSKDEDIELISVEKFLEEAPEEITKPFKGVELTDSLTHELHLARLEYELTQRKKLAELCHTFEDEKKKLAADIVERKKRLEGLGPRLSAVLEATKPLQEHLGLHIDKVKAEHKLASLLPDSLYLLYVNSDAYGQVYNVDMQVTILGDQEEANQWIELQKVQTKEENELEIETPDTEEVVEVVKKRRHRKASQIDPKEEKINKILEIHPLSILITLSLKNDTKLNIKFQYRPPLKIVTVTSTIDIPNEISGNSAKEVLSGESILNELIENDFGTSSPNPSNHYLLQKYGMGSFQSLIPKLGYAYEWAQKACGLDFLNAEPSKDVSLSLSQVNVEFVIKTIYKRLKSRYALAEQLQQIEQNQLPILPDNVDHPKTSISALVKWSSVNWQTYCQSPSTKNILEADLVSSSDLFYMATITRNNAKLIALIAIKNNYPVEVPIFSLLLKYNGDLHSGNSDEIRDMERAVNIGWEKYSQTAPWLLTAQLRHLCAYLDVYLETTNSANFSQNMVFFKNVTGRNRRRPFKFRKMGAGVFT